VTNFVHLRNEGHQSSVHTGKKRFNRHTSHPDISGSSVCGTEWLPLPKTIPTLTAGVLSNEKSIPCPSRIGKIRSCIVMMTGELQHQVKPIIKL
jgi:hypothetical protein